MESEVVTFGFQPEARRLPCPLPLHFYRRCVMDYEILKRHYFKITGLFDAGRIIAKYTATPFERVWIALEHLRDLADRRFYAK